MHVIHEPTDPPFEKVGIRGRIFSTQQLDTKAQFVLIETETGHETTIIEHGCLFAYYVLEGAGYFEIDGNREDCTKGDLVFIPQGKAFTYKGNLKMLLVTAPAWTEDQEETLSS